MVCFFNLLSKSMEALNIETFFSFRTLSESLDISNFLLRLILAHLSTQWILDLVTVLKLVKSPDEF